MTPKASSPAGSLEGSGFMYSENRGASSDPSLSMLKKAGVVCRLEIAGKARPCRAGSRLKTHCQRCLTTEQSLLCGITLLHCKRASSHALHQMCISD